MDEFYWVLGLLGALALLIALLRSAIRLGGAKFRMTDPLSLIRKTGLEAEVEPVQSGILHFYWGDIVDKVQIFGGSTPDDIDRKNSLLEVCSANEANLSFAGAVPFRPYFDLVFSGGRMDGKTIQTAQRAIPLEGLANFRDLGGYRTQEGKHIRWGRVFRSDEWGDLTAQDLKQVQQLNLKMFVDLRTTDEHQKKVNLFPETKQPLRLHIPVYEAEPILSMLPFILFRRHELSRMMSRNYIRMVEVGGAAFGKVLKLIAEEQNLPLVYHCTAGKDRTGVLTALLLCVLGIPEETILADYSLSNLAFEHIFGEFRRMEKKVSLGIPEEEVRDSFLADPSWLEGALCHIRRKYGSIEDYLMIRGGVSLGFMDQIRINLLED